MAYIQLYLIIFTALTIFLSSNGKYVGIPRNAKFLRVAVTKKITLKCLYNVTDGDGDGQFLGWYNDNGTIKNDKFDHYVVKNTPKNSTLVITFTKADHEMKKWYVKTSKPNQEEPIECEFGQIALKPTPERIETNRITDKLITDGTSVRRLRDESVSFKCIIEPYVASQPGKSLTKWEFSKDGEKYSKELPSEVQNKNENEISIDRINKIHRGYYRCERNNVTFSALLRVKDPFAALWPFIGIVCTVLVLVVIILIYEKRQKLARKAAAEEDEVNDNANDPLVQSPNKLSDDENKKRTVKA